MPRFNLPVRFWFLIPACIGLALPTAAADRKPVDFSRDIRPIFSNYCFKCHGPDAKTRKAELRLDQKAGAFADRDGTKVIVAGNPSNSELFRRITSKDADVRMPPKSEKLQLNERQIELLKRWIEQGAKWEAHWAFQPPKRSAVPLTSVRNRGRVRNAIDGFIIARLEKEGLEPSPEARKETLIRRVTLDLTGLPPTIAEIDAFLADKSPNAYEKVVDRLLASPACGERMAWDWLDASRYADSNGFQGDPERTMWPWRDWLVRALNQNRPFDRFTVEMLAGDLLPPPQSPPYQGGARGGLQQVVATGFNRNHMINGEGGRIPEETRVENVFDRTETTATVWMGLTMTCCRCHDHKFDPILQREYYSLYAFFNNTSEDGRGRSGAAKPAVSYVPRDVRRLIAELDGQIPSRAAKLAALEQQQSPRLDSAPPKQAKSDPKQWNAVRSILGKKPARRNVKELRTLAAFFAKSHPGYANAVRQLAAVRVRRDGAGKRAVRVMVMDDLKKRRETFVLTRGTYNKPTVKVTAGTPSFLPPLPKDAPRNRLALAKWLVSPSHPLTARVTVNRMWQQFFGVGIVKTAEDFGTQGESPSHPQLLDWLATEFIRSGWDVKHMHRLIVTSATYRQSSVGQAFQPDRHAPGESTINQAPGQAGKPDLRENRLLSRFPRYRLPSWMLRDQALAVSGLCVPELGGPPVKPYQPPGIWAEATFGKKRYVQDHGDKLYRRSLYVFWRRIVGPTMFFDSAARQTCEVKPSRTNTPLHALTTLNDTTYVEAARVFAERVMKQEKSPEERITLAFRMATARKPSSLELAILRSRLQVLRREFQADRKSATALLKVGEYPRDESLNATDHAAMTALCTLILNLDEVLSKE
jgi:mono/diheme cytochrome c family protein